MGRGRINQPRLPGKLYRLDGSLIRQAEDCDIRLRKGLYPGSVIFTMCWI